MLKSKSRGGNVHYTSRSVGSPELDLIRFDHATQVLTVALLQDKVFDANSPHWIDDVAWPRHKGWAQGVTSQRKALGTSGS